MKTIINMTPHALKIQKIDGSFVELPKPVEGTLVPRRAVKSEAGESIHGLAVSKTVFGEVQDLPEEIKDTIYVVSRLVLDGAPHRQDLFSPGELLRDNNGAVIGAKGLAQ